MSTELKIKAKTLAEESRIIRKEEKKAKQKGDRETLQSLHHHRLHHVRPAARSTHLARAFIRGLKYRQVEETCRREPNRNEVMRLLERYGPAEFRNQTKEDRQKVLDDWFNAE